MLTNLINNLRAIKRLESTVLAERWQQGSASRIPAPTMPPPSKPSKPKKPSKPNRKPSASGGAGGAGGAIDPVAQAEAELLAAMARLKQMAPDRAAAVAVNVADEVAPNRPRPQPIQQQQFPPIQQQTGMRFNQGPQPSPPAQQQQQGGWGGQQQQQQQQPIQQQQQQGGWGQQQSQQQQQQFQQQPPPKQHPPKNQPMQFRKATKASYDPKTGRFVRVGKEGGGVGVGGGRGRKGSAGQGSGGGKSEKPPKPARKAATARNPNPRLAPIEERRKLQQARFAALRSEKRAHHTARRDGAAAKKALASKYAPCRSMVFAPTPTLKAMAERNEKNRKDEPPPNTPVEILLLRDT